MDASVLTRDVRGLRIGYRRAGSGEPLLLLHGAFGDSREWRPQLVGLAGGLDVIAMDCLGCGASDDPPAGFGPADYADIVVGLLDALGLRSAHVGGLSFGAVYALLTYRERPDRVRSLVLASAYAGWAGSLPAEEVERRLRWMEVTLTRPVEEWGPEFLRTVYSDRAPQALRTEAMAVLRDARPGSFEPVARTFAALDLSGMLGAIRVPVLIVAGDRDQRAPVRTARTLAARIPAAQLAVIPGAGHGVNGEAPDDFDAAVLRFLTGRSPG